MASGWTLADPATEEPFLDVALTEAAALSRALAGARAAQRAWREVPVERVPIVR